MAGIIPTVTPRITPTILIGLGGTGREVLLRLRRRFYERFGPLEGFPTVSYVYVDTDITDTHHSDETRFNSLITQQIDFKPNERIDAVIRNPGAFINNAADHPNIASWFPTDLAIAGDMVAGASQVRARGRLAFHVNYQAIKRAVQDARTAVTAQAARTAINRWNLQAGGDLNVYMVGSLAGGTGSGMFLDMTYLVRDLLPDARRVGFLLLPRAFGEAQAEPKMWANGYAAFKELDFFQLGGRTWSRQPRLGASSRRLGFPAEWEKGRGLPDEAARSHPFDFCYLVDGYNESDVNQVHQRNGLFQLIADAIFHDFGQRDFAEKKTAHVLDNLRPFISGWWEEPNTNRLVPTRYSSLGLASITFPADRVKLACAAKLGLAIVEHWTRQQDNTNVVLGRDTVVEKFLNPLGLVEGNYREGTRIRQRSDIIEGLLRRGDSANVTIRNEVKKWHDDLELQVPQKAARQGKAPRQYLEEAIHQFEKNFAGRLSENPTDWGTYVRQVHENRASMQRRITTEIRGRIDEMIRDQFAGVGYALEVLNWVGQILSKPGEGYLDRFRKESKDLEDRVTRRQAQVNRALGELSNYDTSLSRFHPLRKATMNHLCVKVVQASRLYFADLVDLTARADAIRLCEEISRFIAARDTTTGDSTGLRAQLAGLLEDLGRLRTRLGQKLDAYKGAVESPRQVLLYDPSELDEIYGRYVRHGEIAGISQEFQEKRRINLLDYSVGEHADLRADELMEFARDRFRGIDRDFVAIDMFYQRYGDPQVRSTALGNLMRASQVWVKWANDTSVGPQLQPQQQRYVVAFSDPNGQRTQAFREEVRSARVPGQAQPDFFVIDSPHEILFYAETGGFALSRLEAARFMKEAYQSHRDKSVPLHIDRPESRFPDVMLTNPKDLQDLREATDLFHTARAMNALEPLPVAGAENAVSYRFHHFLNVALGTRSYTLGDNDRAIELLRRDPELRKALRNRIMALRQVIYNDKLLMMSFAALCRWYATSVYGPEDVEGSHWSPPEAAFYEREARAAVDELTRNGEFDRNTYEALAQAVATPGDRVTQELPDGFRVLLWTPPAPADLG